MEGGAVGNDADAETCLPPPVKKKGVFKGKRQAKKLGRRGKRGGDRKAQRVEANGPYGGALPLGAADGDGGDPAGGAAVDQSAQATEGAVPVPQALARAVAADHPCDNTHNEDTVSRPSRSASRQSRSVSRPSRSATRKLTIAQYVNLISSEKKHSSRERDLKEAAIEGKAKAEKLAAKHHKKIGDLSDTVRIARQQTRSAKKSWSEAEREAKVAKQLQSKAERERRR